MYKDQIWPISLVSFCWSASSMMVASVLPIYLVEVLNVGYVKIGYLEGMAVFCAFIAKVFSGILSDRVQKRHLLILIGSIITVITKPMLALSTTYSSVFLSRFFDRLAKGIRSAPTDALIADLNPGTLNYAFGFRQAVYILGAVFGALTSMFIMFIFELHSYRFIFSLAVIPAVMAVIILLIFVKDPVFYKVKQLNEKISIRHISFINFSDFKKFPGYYWGLLFVTFFLMIARFSESFLSLKAKQFGWPICWLPLTIIISDLSHSYFSFISRKCATQDSAEKLLIIGLFTLIVANATWILANSNTTLIIAIILTGMHLGITQGVLRTLIAMSSPSINGTAFALFYLVSGCGVFIGNLIAGFLAQSFYLSAIFIGGMVAASISLILSLGINFYRRKSI